MSKIQIEGEAKDIISIHTQVGGVVKDCIEMYIQEGGVIKQSDCGPTEPECDPLTGDAAVFLTAPTSHTYFGAKPAGWNATMESLPDDRVFPEGQKMYISAFEPSLSYVPDASAAGFSVVGPWRNTYDNIKSNWADSRIANDDTIQITAYLRNMRAINNPGGTISVEWNNKDAVALYDIAKSEVDLYRADVNLTGHKIHGWLYCLDDYGSELPDYGKLHEFMGYLNTYLGDESVGNQVKGNRFTAGPVYANYMPEATNMENQTYFDGGTCDQAGYWNHKSLLWFNVNGQYHAEIDAATESPTGQPRLLPIMPIIGLSLPSAGDPNETIDWQTNNSEYMSREHQITFLNGIMCGHNGFTYYGMAAGGQGQCGTAQSYRDALRTNFFDFLTKITSHAVDRALLWGKGAIAQKYDSAYDPADHHVAPIVKTRISGAATYLTYGNDLDANGLPTGWGSTAYNWDAITYRDIQYKGVRFVVVTNACPDPEIFNDINIPDPGNNGVVVSDFSGFPTNGQIKITDILSGTDYTTDTGTVRLTMQPNTAVILKVEPADGFCGGNEPQPAPVITEHPQDQSVTAPAPASWSVAYSPPTASVQWQWHPVPFTDDDWRNIDGETGDTYSKVTTNTGMNGENYRAVVTTAGNDPVPSNPALLTVT